MPRRNEFIKHPRRDPNKARSRKFSLASMFVVLGAMVGGCRTTPAIRSHHLHNLHVQITPWTDEGFSGRRMVSEQFEIYSTLTDVEFEREIAPLMEAAYVKYAAMIPPTHAAARPMPLYIFATRIEWEQFTREHYPVRYETYARIHAGGFTESGAAIVYYTGRNTTLATLLHEGWHQYAAACLSSEPPVWLNEGLACHFESGELHGDRLLVPKRNTLRLNGLRLALHNGQLISLRQLLCTDAGDVLSRDESTLTQSYYAQAWGLVAFLRDGAGGRYRADFQTLLSDISSDRYRVRESAAQLTAGESASDSSAVVTFERYFHTSLSAIEPRYEEFLRTIAGFR